MALPINIDELIHGRVVEWDRLEFKAGWNPEEVLHTVCAFANDINNWGGGYIVIGIDSVEGVPVLPPRGISHHSIDRIQGELVRIFYQIQPNYLPVSQPVTIDERHILIIWIPAGDMRPYSCPSTLGNDARRQYYIRSGSHTIIAQGINQTRLLEIAARVPFDDRINHEAKLEDLSLGLIREFLQSVKSELFEESVRIPFPDLCKQIQLIRGPAEFMRPVNAALLFFHPEPHKYFRRAWIELAIHTDDTGRNFTSETIYGPLHKQIGHTLALLKAKVLVTHTEKIAGEAESLVYGNWPYNALEEVIANAVYHKSYQEEKPIEIQVFPDRIEILSFPGPLPPISNEDLQNRRVIARDYRNRRIGDFLKELRLTEGKATGFPIIRDAMRTNGNPDPVFYTDKEKTLFLVTLPCHPSSLVTKSVIKSTGVVTMESLLDFLLYIKDLKVFIAFAQAFIRKGLNDEVTKSVTKSETKSEDGFGARIGIILRSLNVGPQKKEYLLSLIGVKNQTKNKKRYISPLLESGWIEMTIPDKPNSQHQKYKFSSTFLCFISR